MLAAEQPKVRRFVVELGIYGPEGTPHAELGGETPAESSSPANAVSAKSLTYVAG